MRTRRTTLAIGVLAALLGAPLAPALAAPTDLQAQLVEQGQYWQARNNNQRAAEVWQKVLQLDKSQVNALYGMGLIGVKQNRLQQANAYLERLQALSPQPWQAAQLMQDIALARPENQALLAEARRLVDAGERDRRGLSPRALHGDRREDRTPGARTTERHDVPGDRAARQRLRAASPRDECRS